MELTEVQKKFIGDILVFNRILTLTEEQRKLFVKEQRLSPSELTKTQLSLMTLTQIMILNGGKEVILPIHVEKAGRDPILLIGNGAIGFVGGPGTYPIPEVLANLISSTLVITTSSK